MSGNRYRRVYGATHDTVHIRDDCTNRKIIDEIGELNELNDISVALFKFIKDNNHELIRIEEDYDVKWMVTPPEHLANYSGKADIKTYEEYLDSIRK